MQINNTKSCLKMKDTVLFQTRLSAKIFLLYNT